jgi:hypothetical protein
MRGWRLAAGGKIWRCAFIVLVVMAAIPLAGAAEDTGRDAVRERWKRLTPEKRRELLRLHERLQELPPAERKLLLDRLRSMDLPRRREALGRARKAIEENALERPAGEVRRELVRKLWDSLPPEERKRLRSLPPRERRRYLEEKVATRRQALLDQLAPEDRKRIAGLPAEKQVEALRRLRTEETFRRTFRDPAEVEHLRALRPRQLAGILGVPAGGGKLEGAEKPEFLSVETWQRWVELKPYERLRVLRHLRSRTRPVER